MYIVNNVLHSEYEDITTNIVIVIVIYIYTYWDEEHIFIFLKEWCAKSKSENINIYYRDGILPTDAWL
jgi:hypothetical protein